jgi:Tfp pilus assembly protein PilX
MGRDLLREEKGMALILALLSLLLVTVITLIVL